MSRPVTILPGPFEQLAKQHLIARGLALSNVQRGSHLRTVAHRPFVPVLRNVVTLRRRLVVDEIFRFADRPQ